MILSKFHKKNTLATFTCESERLINLDLLRSNEAYYFFLENEICSFKFFKSTYNSEVNYLYKKHKKKMLYITERKKKMISFPGYLH